MHKKEQREQIPGKGWGIQSSEDGTRTTGAGILYYWWNTKGSMS